MLADVDDLKRALTRLRFEGRQHFKKNFLKVSSILRILKERLLSHVEEEEESLFPFLLRRLPKLEPVMHLFLSEHREFKEYIKRMAALLRKLRVKKSNIARGILVYDIHSQGTYLFCLVTSHIKMESRKLYDVLENELNTDEKNKLMNIFALTDGSGIK